MAERPYKPREASMTSRVMAAIRGRDNKAEVKLRKELWRRGFRYRIHVRSVYGCPDIVFGRVRLAIFIDGDFWHARRLMEGGPEVLYASLRTPRRDWWVTKLSRTVERDRRVTQALEEEGWTVIRVWESDVQRDLHRVAGQIASALEALHGPVRR
jgi:DNA mismatch endonuclease (patch repair protein)